MFPPVARLGLIVSNQNEIIEIDSGNMESAFNQFFQLPAPRKDPDSVCQCGDPNKWVCAAIGTVPMG